MTSGGNDDSSVPGAASTVSAPAAVDRTLTREPGEIPGPLPPRSMPAAPPPRDPRRYDVLGEHGRGGLGRVSRARDRELGRDVAIKELIARSHVSEVRFLREALITARLEHPGIVPVHEAGRWPDGTPFYAMKLVAGRPLRDLIAERKTLDERIGLLHHVIAVADAIAYAHGRSIIHRDLKPANVIVGDFGETVVIDWGLAKDLSVAEESSVGGGPFREGRDDGLTSAGSVLGTPAYMPPEQARGEPVDQRADVFAIGAMLWELCSLQKVPPGDARQRHRALRRNGIDPDLAAIVEKALDAEPARRYPDAGALAADLKAFKAGIRIAARRYSLWALLAHWTRRHRTAAIGSAAALVAAIAGAALYVGAVTRERDRADASEQHARQALDALTLKHAQLLLASDPSAAVDALATYRGSDADREAQIRAEATGRGVAVLRARPHTDRVRWAAVAPSGAIVSLSADGTLARTSLDGASVVVARGVGSARIWSYAPARHLLAYGCDPGDLCLYDVGRDAVIPVAASLRSARPDRFALSRDGNRLAVMSRDAVLTVFDIADPAHPAVLLQRPIQDGSDVTFFDRDIIAAGTPHSVEFVHLQGGSERFEVPDSSYWDASPDEQLFALATIHGQVSILEGSPVRIAARKDLCNGRVAGMQFIPGRRSLAYACTAGTVGIWDLRRDVATQRLQLEGHADLVAVSPDGDYLVAAGGTGTVTVLDLTTDLVASYKGHEFRLTAITAPVPGHPVVISADVLGSLRVWPLPPRVARVAATTDRRFYAASFHDRSTVTATSFGGALTTLSPATGIQTSGPHESLNIQIQPSSSRQTFATYGLEDVVEIWSWATLERTRVIPTHHGSVSQVALIDDSGGDPGGDRGGDTGELISSGRDGRLVRWSASGEPAVLAKLDQPIDGFARISRTGEIVFAGADGALWRTGGGHTVALRPAGARIIRLVVSPDERTVYAGTADGDVLAIDTASWRQDLALHAAGAVQELSITDDSQTLAVATKDGKVHIGARRDSPIPTWHTLMVQARHLALTPDGLLIAPSTDGVVWIYAIARRRWLCLPMGSGDLRWVTISSDAAAAVAVDYEGRLLWIDLHAARAYLADQARPQP
ncbi:MAG TPA: WD40 repeat domain-containing serine/threonine-protein kinase [Kofleriaceae bacterium]|nr:WD40 repeat domain-containing serine/threonine-protein kinase [Kofleriaceae bacterium]